MMVGAAVYPVPETLSLFPVRLAQSIDGSGITILVFRPLHPFP